MSINKGKNNLSVSKKKNLSDIVPHKIQNNKIIIKEKNIQIEYSKKSEKEFEDSYKFEHKVVDFEDCTSSEKKAILESKISCLKRKNNVYKPIKEKRYAKKVC